MKSILILILMLYTLPLISKTLTTSERINDLALHLENKSNQYSNLSVEESMRASTASLYLSGFIDGHFTAIANLATKGHIRSLRYEIDSESKSELDLEYLRNKKIPFERKNYDAASDIILGYNQPLELNFDIAAKIVVKYAEDNPHKLTMDLSEFIFEALKEAYSE